MRLRSKTVDLRGVLGRVRPVLGDHEGDHVAAAANGVGAEHAAFDFQQPVR